MNVAGLLAIVLLAIPALGQDLQHTDATPEQEAAALNSRAENLEALRKSLPRYVRVAHNPKSAPRLEAEQKKEIIDFLVRLSEAVKSSSFSAAEANLFLDEMDEWNLTKLRAYHLDLGGPLTWLQVRLHDHAAVRPYTER